ncbi:MAG TPA: acyltransferase, partial [Acidisoma sp.]|uniref:acyltransferase family protein n=1 Tax=Acidisoma sp. TaxID=1872115 RepID=UPI002CE714D1
MGEFNNPRATLADLTAVRACFALWVFLYHTNLHLHFVDLDSGIARGYLGVDGFFILSGLVLAHRYPHAVPERSALARFWWRRLVRLYPTALAILLLLAAAYLLARAGGIHPHQALRADGREFLLQLFLLNGLGLSRGWTWNYPSWSISTEWVGYLLFPFLSLGVAGLAPRRAALGAVLSGLALLAVTLVSPVGLNLSYQGALPRFLPEFFSGICLARMLRGSVPLRPGLAAALGLLLAAVGIWARPHMMAGDALVTFGLWFLLWALAAAKRPFLARIPGFLPLGRISYPFYMAYAPVEILFARLWHR